MVSQTFQPKADQTEQWYGVQYGIEPHDSDLEDKWREPETNESLKLPEPNAFIPHNFDICERDPDHSEFPRIIKVWKFAVWLAYVLWE